MAKQPVFLLDLTHQNQLGLGSDTMPLQLGLIAAYAQKLHGHLAEFHIIKFLDELNQLLASHVPLLVGASNYVWNLDLTYQALSLIKQDHPQAVTVMGGPNFPKERADQEKWLADHPLVDFYIYRDGELPFARLLGKLLDGENMEDLKAAGLPSCLARRDGQVHVGPLEPRLKDLDLIPSPYAAGLMDKFFSSKLIPAMRTNRGCPFKCTFCEEGDEYYNWVYRAGAERRKAEARYIAERTRHTGTLRIADSNFAMYKEDEEFCAYLGRLQAETGYPNYINTSTGKNKKERVLACNRLVGGAMRFTLSVQSLNRTVLGHVRRSNISIDQMMAVAVQVADTETHAYSEIILGLPGDSLAAQVETMSGLIEADVNNITQHQLSMIPGTEVASPASRRRFGLQGRFRPIQRCLGEYALLGRSFPSVEIEEICVASATLPFEDYLEARTLYLTMALFYNDRVFGEVHALLRAMGLPTWAWLHGLHGHVQAGPAAVRDLYANFRAETAGELWDDPQRLREDVIAAISDYSSGRKGGNLIYKYRSLALVDHFDAFHDFAFGHLRRHLAGLGRLNEATVGDMERFSLARKKDLFIPGREVEESFGYDVLALLSQAPLAPGRSSLDQFRSPTRLRVAHTAEQMATMNQVLDFYGHGAAGITMLLSRFPLKKLYRKATRV